MLKISPFRCQYGLTDPYLVTGKKGVARVTRNCIIAVIGINIPLWSNSGRAFFKIIVYI